MDVGPNHPLRRLFAGLVEHAFQTQVGLCDPNLTDYMADLLVSFTHVDRLNAIREARGKRWEQIAFMLMLQCEDRPASGAERDREVYRHIGDYTLFWAGIYPEQLKRASRRPEDVLLDYVTQGKRSYAIVSDLVDDDDRPPPALFRRLSDDFEFCIHGLGLVRRGWEEVIHHGGDAGELIY